MDQYNILVVDDDREIVSAIAIYLENEGMHVVKAYDSLEALEAVAQGDIHLIVMDIMMPKLDGMKATMRLREENNIPIILLSAKSEDTDKILGLNMGGRLHHQTFQSPGADCPGKIPAAPVHKAGNSAPGTAR